MIQKLALGRGQIETELSIIDYLIALRIRAFLHDFTNPFDRLLQVA
jgi:hypothetical protein